MNVYELERTADAIDECIVKVPYGENPKKLGYYVLTTYYKIVDSLQLYGIRATPIFYIDDETFYGVRGKHQLPFSMASGARLSTFESRDHLRQCMFPNCVYLVIDQGYRVSSFIGPKGQVIMNYEVKGRRIGGYMLGMVLAWGKANFPEMPLNRVSISGVDAVDEENKNRRNRFYARHGLKPELDDCGVAGTFYIGQLGDLTPNTDCGSFEFTDWSGLGREIGEMYKNIKLHSDLISEHRKKFTKTLLHHEYPKDDCILNLAGVIELRGKLLAASNRLRRLIDFEHELKEDIALGRHLSVWGLLRFKVASLFGV